MVNSGLSLSPPCVSLESCVFLGTELLHLNVRLHCHESFIISSFTDCGICGHVMLVITDTGSVPGPSLSCLPASPVSFTNLRVSTHVIRLFRPTFRFSMISIIILVSILLL